jgi:hypothetical protein
MLIAELTDTNRNRHRNGELYSNEMGMSRSD